MWTANIPSSQNLINKTRSGLALTLFFIIFLCYTLSRLNEHYPFFFFSFFFFLFSVMLNLTVPSHEKGLALTNWPKNKKKNTRSKKNLCCLANWPPTCLLPHNIKYVILSKYFFVSTAFHLLFAFYILIAQFIFR
jgi:hypothetical protein